jgi:hypothetical protein
MIFVGGVLGRGVAVAFLGHDMDQHRLVDLVPGVL